MWLWWRLIPLILGKITIIKIPTTNGTIIGNSGITVVPIIETLPELSGFMLTQT